MKTDFKALKAKAKEEFQGFDTFEAPKNCLNVTFTTKELTSFCPVTGQPDYSECNISYKPRKLCVESKSLKLYLQSFREEGIFGEFLAEKICKDLFDALHPKSIRVTIQQGVRGGLQMDSTSVMYKEPNYE